MSLLSSIGGLAKSGVGLLKTAGKLPGVGMIPVVGTVLSAAGTAASLYSAFGSKDSTPSAGGLPALPSGGLPALPAGGTTTTAAVAMPGGGTSLKTVHINPAFPQDKASLDSWIAAGLLVPFNHLRSSYRAPKGYRVTHVNGVTMAVRSDIARKMHLVKPTHKPPISVGEWHALKKAHKTVKKVHKLHGIIKYVADHTTTHGQVKIAHHKKHRKVA